MAVPNPLTLAAMGLGTLGSLAGGVVDSFGAAERKRKYLEDEQRKARILALRNSRWGNFMPTNALDARWKKYEVMRNAEDNPAFNANPLSFLPFVSNATKLAGGIYDYANKPPAPDPDAIPPGPGLPAPASLRYYGGPSAPSGFEGWSEDEVSDSPWFHR